MADRSLRSQENDQNESQISAEPEQPVMARDQQVLEKAFDFVSKLDNTTSTRGNIRFSLEVDNIVQTAMSAGLSPDKLMTLLGVIFSPNPKIGQAIRSKLVKCLIPSHSVPQNAVVKVIYKITAQAAAGPKPLHALLLRWILVVFDYLDGYDKLHRVYGLVFSFLDFSRLLPQACQLLYLLTRRDDVALFRVQKLLDLVRLMGPEPCIMGLLMIYKVYCPHLVTIRLNYGTRSFFKNTDPVWRQTVEAVSAKQREDMRKEEVETARKRKERAQRRKGKRQKLLVPQAHSASQEIEEEEDLPEEDVHPGARTKVPYVQIDTFTSFLQNLGNIQYPSQACAVLLDSQLQLLMKCDPDPVIMTRLSLWIQHMFAFGFKAAEVESKENEELLKLLLRFTQNVQSLPVVEAFLSSYLPTWDGHKYCPIIFCLISCLRPSLEPQDLSSEVLQPLLRLYYSTDVYFKVGMIESLTRLLHRWAMDFWQANKRNETNKQANTEESQNQQAESGQSPTEQGDDQQNVTDVGNTEKLVLLMIKCLDTSVATGLRMENDHYLLQRAGLEFVAVVSTLYQKWNLPILCFPTKSFYRLLMSTCPATLASLCSSLNVFRKMATDVLGFHKSSTDKSVQHQDATAHFLLCDTDTSFPWSADAIMKADYGSSQALGIERPLNLKLGRDVFNSVVLDVLDMLWFGRQSKPELQTTLRSIQLPGDVDRNFIQQGLTVFQGPAFLGLAYKFLQESRGAEKRSHPTQIKKYKEIYLQFLEREGYPEFRECVNTNLTRQKYKSILETDKSTISSN